MSELEALRARIVELETEVERCRQLPAQLEEMQRKLHVLLSTSANILWEVNRDGIVVMSEGQGLVTVGLLPGQTVGMSIRDLYADSPEVLVALERGLRGETFSSTVELAGVTFENHYFPKLADDGSVESLLGVTVVTSGRREAEVELRRAEERLQHAQKQESLAVLAGGIAHDFNNLLVGSLGHADLALRLVPEDSEIAEHLREIVHSAERSADLCRQLLAYAGRGQFIIDVIDLNQVVKDSIRLIQLAIAQTSTLATSLAPNLPPFRGDATQIAQVLINLMKNASDAAEGKPATIHLSTGVRYVEPEVRSFTIVAPEAKPGDYVFVRIRDEGIGMQGAVLGRIFDPFFSTKQTGRGLGLAAVVGIVRSHGGLLEVETEVGVGTTMVVYLPVAARAEESAPKAPPSAQPGQHERATILLVDDEPAARRVARSMLELVGCRVIPTFRFPGGLPLFPSYAVARSRCFPGLRPRAGAIAILGGSWRPVIPMAMGYFFPRRSHRDAARQLPMCPHRTIGRRKESHAQRPDQEPRYRLRRSRPRAHAPLLLGNARVRVRGRGFRRGLPPGASTG